MHARSWAFAAVALGAVVVAVSAATAIAVAPPAISVAPAISVRAERASVEVPASAAESVAIPADVVAVLPVVTQTRVSTAARQAVAKRAALAARQAAFATFTLKSSRATDMRGVEGSLYRGRFFSARSEAKRLCIVERESEGFYDVVNPGGSYFGAYQVSRPLARGVTYMMAKEHKALMGEARAKEVLARLRATPMNRWSRYWQDAAFHTIMNWDGELSGAAHWAGGRWHC